MTSSSLLPRRRDAFREALVSGAAESHLTAMRAADRFHALPVYGRVLVTFALVGAFVLVSCAKAFANHEATDEGGCESSSANTLLTFVDYAASFLVGVGAGMAGLMFALGALFIIFGGTPQRVSKGMDMLKNTVVGLAILASGGFLKYIVVGFVFQRKSELPTSC